MADAVSLEQILRYKSRDVQAVNSNDVKSFVYDWFAHFDRIAAPDYFLDHLDPDDMALVFARTIRDHDGFRAWYADWVRHCPWDFHDISDLEVSGSSETGFTAQFTVRHVGEWHGTSETENPGMQEGPFDRTVGQLWRVKVVEGQFFITDYRVA